MFDIAICNDNVNELGYLNYLLEAYRLDHPWPVINIRRFQSLYDLVDCIRAGRAFFLYILGHNSELWMNGLSPAAVLRREEPRGEIIAVTSTPPAALHPSAADPLRLAAVLLRPVQDRALYQVLDRLIKAHQAGDRFQQPCLDFPVKKGSIALPFDKISHLYYGNHKVFCWLADHSTETTPVLREPFYRLIRPLLLDPRFTQVSTAWVVNMDFVEQMMRKPSEVRMSDKTRIRVPVNAIDGTLEEYDRYIALPGKKRTDPVVAYSPQT